MGSLDIWKTEMVLRRSMPGPTNVQTPADNDEGRKGSHEGHGGHGVAEKLGPSGLE